MTSGLALMGDLDLAVAEKASGAGHALDLVGLEQGGDAARELPHPTTRSLDDRR